MFDNDVLADSIRRQASDALQYIDDTHDAIEMNAPEARDKALKDAETSLELIRDYASRLLGDYSHMPFNSDLPPISGEWEEL